MIRAVVFDLDGTLYRGDDAVPGAAKAVAECRRRGLAVRFLTNNSALSRDGIAARLTGMGIPATTGECHGTGPAALEFCREQGWSRVLVLGEPGLHQLFVGMDREPYEAVVVGVCRTFTYALCDAALQAVRAGARFIATNRDRTYPLEGGRVQPGAGAMVAAVEAACGVPPIVLGKPEPSMVLTMIRELGVRPEEVLMVGDRLETDIEAGRRAGTQTLLVLTGVTSSAPEGVSRIPSVADLPNWL